MRAVYRIECAKTGHGVYHCGARCALDNKGTTAANHAYHLLNSAPTPWHRDEFRHVRDVHSREKHFFGWANIDQAESYFKHKMNIVLNELSKLEGYDLLLVRFEAPENEVIEADTQVIFDKSVAVRKESWTMQEALTQLEAGLFYERTNNRPDARSSIPALDYQYNPS